MLFELLCHMPFESNHVQVVETAVPADMSEEVEVRRSELVERVSEVRQALNKQGLSKQCVVFWECLFSFYKPFGHPHCQVYSPCRHNPGDNLSTLLS